MDGRRNHARIVLFLSATRHARLPDHQCGLQSAVVFPRTLLVLIFLIANTNRNTMRIKIKATTSLSPAIVVPADESVCRASFPLPFASADSTTRHISLNSCVHPRGSHHDDRIHVP